MTDALSRRLRRALVFARRCKMAREGRHLPTLRELLLGMPYFGESLEADAAEFAERLMARFPDATSDGSALGVVLKTLTMSPTVAEFQSAAEMFRQVAVQDEVDQQVWSLRCSFYAASSGCLESALRIATEALSMAADDDDAQDDALELYKQGLGWLILGSVILPTCERRTRRRTLRGSDEIRDAVEMKGSDIVEAIAEQHGDSQGKKDVLSSPGNLTDNVTPPRRVSTTSVDANVDAVAPSSGDGAGVVVCSEIGNPETSEGKRVVREHARLVGKALPLIAVPDLTVALRDLLTAFPYATDVISAFLEEVSARSHVAFRPTILVGTPGSGKSYFADHLLKALGIPHETYPCGGVADAALAGTARRWSTGEPALPVNLIRRFGCASPGIVLDEVDKVGTSSHNGNAHDALLGLLERETAARWHDPYIEAPLDLSHVIWIATANSMEGLSAPLRDRCRVLKFPEPGIAHLPALAPRLLVHLVRDRGLDERWAAPLTSWELEALSNAWRGGSVRRLRRLLEAVLVAREKVSTVH